MCAIKQRVFPRGCAVRSWRASKLARIVENNPLFMSSYSLFEIGMGDVC